MLPRLLVIDDLLGRVLPEAKNPEREAFCGGLLLNDVTEGLGRVVSTQRVRTPLAEVEFLRGQQPVCACEGMRVENDLAGTLDYIVKGWTQAAPRWSLALLDLHFATGEVLGKEQPPGMPIGHPDDRHPNRYFGLALLEGLRRQCPDLPVVILSANPREDVSLKISEQGAVGFIEKGAPSASESLRKVINKHGLLPDDSPADSDSRIVGSSLALLRALRLARLSAGSKKNVLIRGENGTGKELLAEYVHRHSPAGRRRRPFEVVNSARLTPEIYQNELFGYKKDSFTGATDDRVGALRAAEGGDLFLDEIGELHPEVQAGLLRVLEKREYSPYGAPEERVQLKELRFLSATNADLPVLVGRGLFREDLYFRLREFGDELYLPPLRQRPTDIPLLTEYFVRKFERDFAARSREVTSEAMEVLRRYTWPGNVRELRNCLYAAVSRFDDSEYLSPAHLPEVLCNFKGPGSEDRPSRTMGLGTLGSAPDSDARRLALHIRAALDAFLADASDDKH